MPIWEKVGKSVLFADDGCTLISGKHMDDLNNKVSEASIAKCDWYASAGFVINGEKSELMGIGCVPNSITVAGCEVKHKDSIKFLGITISSDLEWNSYVGKLCNKLRYAANRIRNEGRYFSIKDRTTLFNGWARSLLHNNALVFLPFLTKSLTSDLQIAMNAGVRAIFGLCRYGFENIASLRKSVKIPSVIEIKEYVCLKGAWDKRDWFKRQLPANPRTRSQLKRCIPMADTRGWAGKALTTVLTSAWNKLPGEGKDCEDKDEVKKLL